MDNYKEVYFHKYCYRCEHRKADPSEDPCNECLTTPAREYSHKPVLFKEREENNDSQANND